MRAPGPAALAVLLVVPFASARAVSDGEIRQVLLSSAWCTFSYSKVSGASRSERVVFAPDGTMRVSSNADSYSSGRYGSVAGQSAGQLVYFWKVEQGDLQLSEDRFNWEGVGLDGKRGSNGSIILIADGKEYAQCR